MRSRRLDRMGLLVVLSVLLASCGGGSAPGPVLTEGRTAHTPANLGTEPTESPAEAGVPIRQLLDRAFAASLSDLPAYGTLTLDAFIGLLAADPAPFLLDVRETREVEQSGYVDGAVLIPIRTLGRALDRLPSFQTPIVAYCSSGWRCTIAMTVLDALGWETVFALEDGSFGGWVASGYPVVEGLPPRGPIRKAAKPNGRLVTAFDAMLSGIPGGDGVIAAEMLDREIADDPDLILIDVRRPEEIAQGGSIGSANQLAIPLEELVSRRAEWPQDVDAPIVTYCDTGHRSAMAMTILWSYGYSHVRGLFGGLDAWTNAGYPLVFP
jgi:rhodanese-related sulfurtransferase